MVDHIFTHSLNLYFQCRSHQSQLTRPLISMNFIHQLAYSERYILPQLAFLVRCKQLHLIAITAFITALGNYDRAAIATFKPATRNAPLADTYPDFSSHHFKISSSEQKITQIANSAIAPPETLTVPTFSTTPNLQAAPAPSIPQTTIAEPLAPPNNAEISTAPGAALEGITTDFRNDGDGSGLRNRFIEPTAHLRLRNGDQLHFKTGLDSFRQDGVDPIVNVPLQLGWERKVGTATLTTTAGLEVFNRLPVAPTASTKIELPIAVQTDESGRMVKGATVSALVEHGPYKFNARTLDNQIKVTHLKPSVYWQLDRDTSFYAHYQLGVYNDGNVEHQSFSRLEHKFGNFFVAANLFTWNYSFDAESRSGYFSPQDFLTYNGEVGWEGDVFKSLHCRVSANLGQQRLSGNFANATNYDARCSLPISTHLDLTLNYQLSNVRNLTAGSDQHQSIGGQLQWKF